MKSLKLKTKAIVEAYKVLNEAKYQKISDDDKINLWKISRKLAPIAQKFIENVEDAKKKFQPNEDFQQTMVKAREYEKLLKEGSKNLPMPTEEYMEALKQFTQYVTLLNKALEEFQEEEVTLEIEMLSEESFGKLMASNDWTLRQVSSLEFIVE